MNENEHCCCFTGHRPEKCKGSEKEIRMKLAEEIRRAWTEGYDTFITGMAPGVDIWAAEEVIKLKEENASVKLICAVPFQGVERNRTAEQKATFNAILSKADHVEYMASKYKRWCFHARDEWMVDHAQRVIAVYNGTPGGTEFTLRYAKRKEREIVLIDDAALTELSSQTSSPEFQKS